MAEASEVAQKDEPTLENEAPATAVDQTIESESTPSPSEAAAEAVSDSEIENLGTEEVPEASQAADVLPQPSHEELIQQIEVLKLQVEDRTNQYLRNAADFENFRKRTQREKEELELQVKCATVIELLPVVDNFERARSQIKPQTEEGMSIHKSYQGVYKDFVDRLKKIGVAPMRSEGKEFDPNLHEAVMREATSEHSEGTVIEELVRGYLLGERVLRHAMVKVAAPLEPTDESNAESST